LPTLTYSQPSEGAPIGPTAFIPASVSIDLREQPYFSFVYSSGFQVNLDLELRNSAGKVLAAFGASPNLVRITLPRTSGFPRLWTVALTNLLKTNVTDFRVAAFAFLNPTPHPHLIKIDGLGFSTNAPSPSPHLALEIASPSNADITANNSALSAQLFFYNGSVRYAPDLQSDWTLVPAARNLAQTNIQGTGFFTLVPSPLETPPMNLDTNIAPAGTGGFINIPIRSGFQIIANELVYSNTVATGFIPNPPGTLPDGSAIIRLEEPYSYVPPNASNILSAFLQTFGPIDPARININLYQNGVWTDPNESIAPGEAMIFYNPGNEFTAVSLGNFVTGNLMTYVPAGVSIRAPLIPQSGGITTVHKFQPSIGDTVTRITAAGLITYAFVEPGVWDPSEPILEQAEGFLINAQKPFTWTSFFSLF